MIEVEHDTGAISRYTHLSRFSPQLVVGDLVNAGESLGEVGSSGVATGPHLHYEVRVNNLLIPLVKVNASCWVSSRLKVNIKRPFTRQEIAWNKLSARRPFMT